MEWWQSLILVWLAFQLPVGFVVGKIFKERNREREALDCPYGQGEPRDVAYGREISAATKTHR